MTHWFDIDREWLEEIYFTREPDFYKQVYKMNTEGQEMETYQIFLFPMGNTKVTEELEIQARNDLVTANIKGVKQGIILMMKKLLIIHNH